MLQKIIVHVNICGKAFWNQTSMLRLQKPYLYLEERSWKSRIIRKAVTAKKAFQNRMEDAYVALVAK